MNVHEFQAKALLKKYGVSVPAGREVVSPEDAAAAARELGGACVIKAQIHAGGRGKAGGVKVCKTPEEAAEFARGLLTVWAETSPTADPPATEAPIATPTSFSPNSLRFIIRMLLGGADAVHLTTE